MLMAMIDVELIEKFKKFNSKNIIILEFRKLCEVNDVCCRWHVNTFKFSFFFFCQWNCISGGAMKHAQSICNLHVIDPRSG